MTTEEYTLGVRAELRCKSDEYGSLYYKCRIDEDGGVDHELTVFAFGTNETFKFPPLNPKAAAETIHARFTRELSGLKIQEEPIEKAKHFWHSKETQEPQEPKDYVRIGTKYYKYVHTPSHFKGIDDERALVKWKKRTIIDDHGEDFLRHVRKIHDFSMMEDINGLGASQPGSDAPLGADSDRKARKRKAEQPEQSASAGPA